MKSLYYKPITRNYYDIDVDEWKVGRFIARGDFADGHLAYTRIDENGEDIEGEETCYYQVIWGGHLVMFHI